MIYFCLSSIDSDNAYSTYPLLSESNVKDESSSHTNSDQNASLSIASKQNQLGGTKHNDV